jgi:hypothetical protein
MWGFIPVRANAVFLSLSKTTPSLVREARFPSRLPPKGFRGMPPNDVLTSSALGHIAQVSNPAKVGNQGLVPCHRR